MPNTNTNEYANTIIDNRYMAIAQLTADDMGPTSWKQYRQLCDNIAIAAWRSITTNDNDNIVGMSLAGLFTFFGSDAKATVPMQKRVLLACVAIKKCQSDTMKRARKALRDAKIALEEYEEDAENLTTSKDTLEQAVADAKAEVERLEGEPHNVWYEKTPMLDKTKKHATAKCRKLIEDTIADIITERSLMTVEELQEEALALKAARKAKKQTQKTQAKAEAQAESKAE